jgi:hypothetical protein
MNSEIFKWLTKPARWYEFWLPQSGIVGGMIFGALFAVIPAAVYLTW